MLDVAGFVFEPADLFNAVISLCRGRWKEAALKIGKTGAKALDRLEITYKALSGQTADLKRYLNEVAENMRNASLSFGPQ